MQKKPPLSSEVGHLVGQQRERYLEKLKIAGLENDVYLLPPGLFMYVRQHATASSLPDFGAHDLYMYVISNPSPYTGIDLKAFKSLDAYRYFVSGHVTCFYQWIIPGAGGRHLFTAKIAQKYDLQKEEELRYWIEEVTGMPIGENFQLGLKDGVILCELINKLQPGSIKKINNSKLNWHKLENLGNFIKAILAYGLKPNDIFEANDLFENGNMTQVQTTLLALAGMAKTKGMGGKVDIGVKYADKQERMFDDEKLKAGNCVIGLQMGTNKCASQAGMTAYGTRRHLYDPKTQTEKPYDQTTISLQMGTNKGASQAGMGAPGTRRDIYDQKVSLQPVDNSTISLQMGTNKTASQKGMSAYGLGRQIYDPKYCSAGEPGAHTNGSQGTGTTGSEVSDTDYQGDYQAEYHHEYQPQYDEYRGHYDQGIDY